MSTVELGIDRRFWLGPSSANLTELTGLGSGFENLTRTHTGDFNQTIADGLIAGKLGRFIAADLNVACRANSAHDPALRDFHGHRRTYRYQEAPGSETQTGEAIASVSLTLNPQNGLANWALALTGDGLPTPAPAPADTRTPEGIASYSAYDWDLYWCTGAASYHLNPLWETALQLQGTVATDRSRVQAAGTNRIGLTADVTSSGFTATVGLRTGGDLDQIAANPEGWLVMRAAATAANFGYVIPLALRAFTAATPAGTKNTLTAQFSGNEGSLPVAAVPDDDDVTLAAGQIGYAIDPQDGIDYASSGTLDGNGTNFVIAGAPYTRSNT